MLCNIDNLSQYVIRSTDKRALYLRQAYRILNRIIKSKSLLPELCKIREVLKTDHYRGYTEQLVF